MNLKSFIPHITAIIIFLVILSIYFSPALSGKSIEGHDVTQWKGMSKEIMDFREETGDETLWTNSMFGGMPAYLIYTNYTGNILSKYIRKIINLNYFRPISFIFVCLLGFYITLLVFKVNPWLSIVGSIAYAFSTYFFILIIAGHVTKLQALGYMPPIIAGAYLILNRKYFFGSILMTLFLSFQLTVNHLQISYYTFLIVLVLVIFYSVDFIKSKEFKHMIKSSLFFIGVIIIAVGCNIGSIWLTYDYGKDSMRGKSELTFDQDNKTSGLDRDYATEWSYGKWETLNLLIPNFHGGPSVGELSTNSEVYKLLKPNYGAGQAKNIIKGMPLYWGTQRSTSGPVYIGAGILFLFVLGLYLFKNKLKWWLLTITIVSILLSWGRNFPFLTNLFLDFFPGYNKFRTVSMILIIAEFAVPLLAILTIQKAFHEDTSKKELLKAIKNTFYVVGGITMFFALFGKGLFDFTSFHDEAYKNNPVFLNALIEDRKSIFQSDAFRSFLFISLTGITLLAGIYNKLNKNAAYAILGIIFLLDLGLVNSRYVNNDSFNSKRKKETNIIPTQADKYILQDKDPNFRVFNLSVSTFNDATTSYFHKSIGGYHGAKMKRYQELIEHQISKNNMSVLNMLNTKYFIVPDKDRNPIPQKNPNALGNVWFVDSLSLVNNADEEMEALTDFYPSTEAIIDKRFENQITDISIEFDSLAFINLIDYKPNHLTYESNTSSNQLAVFSEIYYDKGWNAYINGKLIPHFRTNYVLRGMIIPEGNNKVEFKFEPTAYKVTNTIALSSSIIFLLFVSGIAVYKRKSFYPEK